MYTHRHNIVYLVLMDAGWGSRLGVHTQTEYCLFIWESRLGVHTQTQYCLPCPHGRWLGIKAWCTHTDRILSTLSSWTLVGNQGLVYTHRQNIVYLVLMDAGLESRLGVHTQTEYCLPCPHGRWFGIKAWCTHTDRILSTLSSWTLVGESRLGVHTQTEYCLPCPHQGLVYTHRTLVWNQGLVYTHRQNIVYLVLMDAGWESRLGVHTQTEYCLPCPHGRWLGIKAWCTHTDRILSTLSSWTLVWNQGLVYTHRQNRLPVLGSRVVPFGMTGGVITMATTHPRQAPRLYRSPCIVSKRDAPPIHSGVRDITGEFHTDMHDILSSLSLSSKRCRIIYTGTELLPRLEVLGSHANVVVAPPLKKQKKTTTKNTLSPWL